MKLEILSVFISEHYPHPVFGCECTPTDAESGQKAVLDIPWEQHLAQLILAGPPL